MQNKTTFEWPGERVWEYGKSFVGLGDEDGMVLLLVSTAI